MEINAKQRLKAGAVPWDKTFKKLAKRQGDAFSFKTKAAGAAQVGQAEEGEVDKLREAHPGNSLLNDVPNIKVVLGGKTSYLTWAEAYNLGHSLIDVAEVSYYG